ncbi:iron complex outermembrane recepter protein [Mariprofundus micogutta]|uniref:Iron complex outermembrane recepter protein n=1 Tax=Mariprofundus micogutta TaxID=1921010 RepID=A0A1L8CJP6_9PROT|nr:TonB-dependent receptor [Mariprofundus micogutta]GAV19144.1 iron complex outermembrane recepter protein [Mariprofundus micogutta]
MNLKMKRHVAVAASLLAFLALPNISGAEDMGLMQVDSTTIDDRFESKRGEPSNVSVISGSKVEKAHAENIKQILDAIPGVTAELQSQDSLKIHIRGVENQRFMGEKPGVAVVIDGVPVFERTGRVNINMDDIESIKVIKGGASYLFGDDALAGAVIITTKRGAKMAGGQLSAEAGSFGYKRGMVRAGFAGDKVSGHVQLSRRDADSYYFQGKYKADYLNGKLQAYLSDTSDLTLGWEVAKRFKDSHGTVEGVTQAAVDPTSVSGRDYARNYNVDLGKYYLTYANDLSESSNLMLNIYQFGDHTKFWTAPIRTGVNRLPVTDVNAYQNDNDYKQTQRGLKGEWRGGSDHLAWLGAFDLRDNSYKNKVTILQDFRASAFSPVTTAGTLISDNQTKERMYAGYGELKFRVADGLTATMNGRYDHIKLSYEDYLPAAPATDLSRRFNVGSWRGGINYEINDSVALYSNITTGFRAPTIQQLFAGTISLTGNVAANPNLTPERAVNYEIGLRGRIAGGVEWDIAAFQIDRKDFILNVAGQYATPNNGVIDQYQNIGGMRNRGLEFSLKSDQEQIFSMDVAYTLLDAKFTRYDNFNLLLGNRFSPRPGANTRISYDNSGNVVPRAPKHKLFVAARVKPFEGFTLTGEMNAQSWYYADEINQEKIGGHAIFDLVANYDFSVGANKAVEFNLFARLDNAFDRTYYNTARGYYDSNADFTYNAEDLSIVVNPGRRWTAGMTATF